MELKISLRAARVNADLTQQEVANKLGVRKETVINWEKGKTEITAVNLNRLCDIYKVSTANILLPNFLT